MRSRPASPTAPAVLRPAVVLAACATAAGYLHRLGSEPWAQIDLDGPLIWLLRTSPEDVVAALLRLAALATCWWVIGSFLTALLVRVVGWRPAIRMVDRLAPLLVRRLAQRLTGGALLAVSVLGPTSPAVALSGYEPAAPVGRFTPPGMAVDDTPASPPVLQRPPATPPTTSTGGERRVAVAPGDHLWGIARAEVARRLGVGPREVAATQVAAYWRRVVAANEGRLRSGDPDLLFPGEVVILPEA